MSPRRPVPFRRARSAPLLLAAVAAAVPADAAGQARPTVGPDDYPRWETLGPWAVDPTGTWLVAEIRLGSGDRELRLRRADGSGEALVLEHGSAPAFSADGRWLGYLKGVSEEERERLEDDDEPVPTRLGLVEPAAGRDTVLFEARAFAFRDDGRWLAAHRPPPSDSVGADLIVLEPWGGGSTSLGNVDAFRWQDEGPLLAATLRTAAGDADGVVVFDPDPGTLRTLASGDARFRSPTWQDGTARLGVLRSVEREEREGEGHDVLVWDDVTRTDPPRVLSAVGRPDLPDTLRVAEEGGIGFEREGQLVLVGVQRWEPAGEDGSEDEEGDGEDADGDEGDEPGPSDVQVWHWDDDDVFRAWEYGASRLARRTHRAAWWTGEDRFVVLGSELDEPVRVPEGARWGLVPDHDPYRVPRRFGARTADWYRVDLRTGERALLARGVEFGVSTGPEGRTALVYRDDRWHAVDLATLRERALGGGDAPSFTRPLDRYDYPGPRPPWGVGGWYAGGTAVLLHDRFDVWRADVEDGTVERLTDGAPRNLRHRVVVPDPDRREGGLEPGEPVWLALFDERTKASGYALLEPDGRVHTAVFEDARVTGLEEARDAERVVVRMERWDDPPDLFTAPGGRPAPDGWRQVTRTNPFHSDFAWGRAELLDYTTDAGHDLQAVLVYPADFEEGRRYPLILYQYERLSDDLHRYRTPSRRSYYDLQAWSQEGYFVLLPDIVYEPGRPGPSALDAVHHALDAAEATGHVDPDRIGLVGHSWGGYQAAYLPTRTDRFAAAVAGAAITDFTSFMGAVHWNGGLPETGHWETGQARMAVPYWEDVEGHLESSPVHHIHELDTPVLLMHGDADGVVDFRQGLEYYNFARRAGKEVVLLVYPGADHGLRREENQADYRTRILQWFGHWLKGEPPAPWIVEGESWEARAERIGDGGR